MKLKNVFRYKNGLALLFTKKDQPATAKLWNGLVFSGSHRKELLDIIEELAFRDDYHLNDIKGKLDVIFDIGANIGAFSICASRKAKKVYSVEAFPPIYEQFKKNVAANGCGHIEAIHCALSDTDGELEMVKGTSMGGNIVYDLIADDPNLKDVETVSVAKYKMATIFKKYGLTKIDLMKIDCEGSEGDIIRGMSDEEMLVTKKYAIEFHDNVSSLKHEEIVERFESLGYQCAVREDESVYGMIYASRA